MFLPCRIHGQKGLACLKKINPQVYRSVADTGLPLKKIKSRAKPWFGDEPYSTLLELDIEKEIKKSGGQVEEGLIVDGEVMATTIMRSALQVSFVLEKSEGKFEWCDICTS